MTKGEMLDQMSERDCQELKKLIVENPECPLLIFVGEDSHVGDFFYESCPECSCYLDEITLYEHNDECQWLDRIDYEERLREDLEDDENYVNLTDEEFDDAISGIVGSTDFVKTICVYVG